MRALLLGCLIGYAVFTIAPANAQAGGSFIVHGLGQRECGEYLSYRQKENNNYDGATARSNAEWALGYISGYNSAKSDKEPRSISVTTVIAYLDRFCRDQPLGYVATAVVCLHANYGGPPRPYCK